MELLTNAVLHNIELSDKNSIDNSIKNTIFLFELLSCFI